MWIFTRWKNSRLTKHTTRAATTASKQHKSPSSRINVSIVTVHSQIVPQRRITPSTRGPKALAGRSQSHDLVTGGHTANHTHVRLTHVPFPPSTDDSSEFGMPSLCDSQGATGNTQEMDTRPSLGSFKRDGSRAAEEQQKRRQLRRTASRTTQDGQRLDDSGGQAQGRQQGSSRRASTKSCPRPSSRRIRRCETYHRCGTLCCSRRRAPMQTACRKRRQEERGHTRSPLFRLGLRGPDQVSPAEGHDGGHADSTRPFGLLGSSGTASAKPNVRRGSILQVGQRRTKQTSRESR